MAAPAITACLIVATAALLTFVGNNSKQNIYNTSNDMHTAKNPIVSTTICSHLPVAENSEDRVQAMQHKPHVIEEIDTRIRRSVVGSRTVPRPIAGISVRALSAVLIYGFTSIFLTLSGRP
jgi:hypothetical protein